MNASYLFLLAFLLGCVCGLRSMTAPALVTWGAHLGWLHLAGSHLNFLASTVSVAVFTILALGELTADKFPFIPSRVSPGPLVVRMIFGALCAWALSVAAAQPPILAAVAGAVGAVAGAFAGYQTRRYLTEQRKLPDLPIALLEDGVAIAVGLFVITRFAAQYLNAGI